MLYSSLNTKHFMSAENYYQTVTEEIILEHSEQN